MKLASVVVLVGCGLPISRATGEPADRCAMVEAAILVNHQGFQDFYQNSMCGKPGKLGRRILVDVVYMDDHARPLFSEKEGCTSRVFALFRADEQQGHRLDTVLRLTIWAGATKQWTFMGSYFDPQIGNETEDGGFDVRDHYCHAIGGYLEREGRRWRAWVDVEKYLHDLQTPSK